MLTRVRCTCGIMVDTAGARPGDQVECLSCGLPVRVPALPPGVGGARHANPPSQPQRVIEEWRVGVDELDVAEIPLAVLPPPPDHIVRTAVATNPAQSRVEWAYYYRCFPAQLAISAGAIALGLAGAASKHPAFLILTAAGALTLLFDVAKVRRKFRIGDVCPAVVVSERPPLVAVRTDLMAGSTEPRSAVKIVRQPLKRLPNGVPPVGTRLAAVSVYYPPVRDGAWSNFDPEVLCCATTNEVDICRATASLGEQDWHALDESLALCPPTQRPGLYTLWDANARGRKRSRGRWVGNILAVGVLAGAVALLVWYAIEDEPVVSPTSVPGRVHTDWGR